MEADPPPAALPRALDVQRFAGAREQEIRSLVGALQEGPLGPKFGVAALPHHLRRRASSHKPFHGHRFRPNAKLQGKRLKLQAAGSEAALEEGAVAVATGTVPGSSEEGPQPQPGSSPAAARPFTNRRMRRTPAALAEQHRRLASWSEASLAASVAWAEALGGSAGGSGSGPLRRLETHVWHAKRLAMEERYGWLLPAGAAGQGRGSRSFAHAARAACLAHDASYHCPLLLSGKWEAVHGLLEAMLPPEEAASLAADWQASSGGGGSWGWEQDVLLHHPGRYPARAICPAQLLLLPPCASGGSAAGSAGDGVQAMDVETPASAATATGGLQAAEAMQACLWVHPAAAAAAHSALRLAAAQQEQQASGPGDVGLAVLDLRRLELRGGGADAALAAALAGATAGGVQQQLAGQRFEEQQAQAARQPAQQAQPAAQQGPGRAAPGLLLPLPSPLAQMQHGDAVQVLLADPSLRRPVQLGSAAGSLLPGIPAGGEQGQAACPTLAEQPGDLACLPRAPLPLSEAEISSLRHQLRRRMLQLDPAAALGSGGSGAADAADPEVQRRAACPAVLVRHDPPGTGGIPGWSLILPPGWAPPLWLAAAYAGCKPAGQREWRWLHALEQRRCFPWDWPDTAGYAALMRQQAQLRQAAQARRPKGKQMLAAPAAPPPWELLLPRDPSNQQEGQGQQQQAQQQQAGQAQQEQQQQQAGQQAEGQAMDVDAAPQGAPASGGSPEGQQMFVARTYATMAAALQGSGRGGGDSVDATGGGIEPLPLAACPAAGTSRQGLLVWRPRQHLPAGQLAGSGLAPPAAATEEAATSPSKAEAAAAAAPRPGNGLCLVEAAVFPVKTGAPAEGAAVCLVAGWEARRCRRPLHVLGARQLRRRQREREEQEAALLELGGDPSELAAPGLSGSDGEVSEDQVQAIGWVLSEAPRGLPRRCGALAAVSAAAAWRLRSLQHGGAASDSSSIMAFVRNPGSASLFPVRLQLVVEQGPA